MPATEIRPSCNSIKYIVHAAIILWKMEREKRERERVFIFKEEIFYYNYLSEVDRKVLCDCFNLSIKKSTSTKARKCFQQGCIKLPSPPPGGE